MNKQTDTRFANPGLINAAGVLIAILLFAANFYIYQYTPLEGTWNDVAINFITTFAALLAAAGATAIYLQYYPGDFPRKVWLHMMIGCWLWFLGEALYEVIAYNAETGEVPIPSIADAGWIIGLLFFTIAFYYQYSIIYPTQKKRIIWIAVGAWAASLIVPLVFVFKEFDWGSYIDYYYPVADLAVGIAGIALVFVFQGGALMRPWIGMFIFGISDFFYAWAVQSQLYAWSSENNSALTFALTFAIDASYLAAYLVLALGFLGHWILLNYGVSNRK